MTLNIVIFFSLFVSASFLLASAADHAERKVYIVYMGNALESKRPAVDHHHSLLLEVIQDEEVARQSRIHCYGKSFNAFAAYLLPDEAQRLQENKNVISVFPSTVRDLHTTRSWDFMGMPLSVKRNLQIESDLIIGILDTGIDIDSPSFNDEGFGPPPSKWKSICQVGANFSSCNNKVIGARNYNLSSFSDESVADNDGHGTHTASTAAGVSVKDASLFGLGQGTARGGVPSARIAVYKVCQRSGCHDADILAAFDDAIDDGVDIISLSLGSGSGPYFHDVIAIGSFHAMMKGIVTTASAGNMGPTFATLRNGAPWVFTVGATSMDRQFTTPLIIGNRTDIMQGSSVNTFNLTDMYPLLAIYPESKSTSVRVVPRQDDNDDDDDVKGKIVFYDELVVGFRPDLKIKKLGGIGFISPCGDGFTSLNVVPAACIDPLILEHIKNYINSTNDHVASILKSIEIQDTSAPSVASFSSRGPDDITRSLIKPDIVAPGVAILAAYTKYNSLSGLPLDDRISKYNVMSGTSMSCPHVAGAAAYVKSFHPHWSTSAIKSALMTTAFEIRGEDKLAEFSYGAGHIDPAKAAQPGLVYDMEGMDYIRFMCNLGYSEDDLKKVIGEGGDRVNCSSIPEFGGEDDLNYPSMLVMHKNGTSNISAVFNRVVKNVGDANSTYKANVTTAGDVQIKVTPDTLVFTQVNEVISFTVEVHGPPLKELNDSLISSSLVWTDSVHTVRSPILIFPDYHH